MIKSYSISQYISHSQSIRFLTASFSLVVLRTSNLFCSSFGTSVKFLLNTAKLLARSLVSIQNRLKSGFIFCELEPISYVMQQTALLNAIAGKDGFERHGA